LIIANGDYIVKFGDFGYLHGRKNGLFG